MYRNLLLRAAAWLALIPAAAPLLLAQPAPPPAPVPLTTISRVSASPHLDDFVAKGTIPAGYTHITGFRQNTPGDGDPVSVGTDVYLGYDENNLYAAFICKDDPSQVRARLVRREEIFGDEGAELFIDTFHDKQRSYVFAVNPFGIQLDGILTEGQGYDFNFDTLWYSEGKVTADGYVTLMTIPFKSLRFAPGPRQTWGVAFGRIIPRKNEFAYWPYITSRVEGFVPQYAAMEIPESLSPGRNYQVIPYSELTRSRLLETRRGEPGYFNTMPGRVGLDGKFVINNSLAADVTVNPDFSEVESDEPQVIVNQRFEVLFPEKRPFFLENSGFFGTPVNLFFSRRVADPRVGARLTGRLGRWAMGGLAIDDRAGGLFLDPTDPGYRRRATVGVVRMQRDFGAASNAGFLVSTRDLNGHKNQVASLDGRLRLNEAWALTGQLGTSSTDTLGDKARGTVGFFDITRSGRNFNYDGQYYDVSRNFDAQLGFIPRTDIRQTTHSASYLKFTDKPTLISYGPRVYGYSTWDHQGTLQDWSVAPTFGWNWTRATTLELTWEQAYELFLGKRFDKHFGTIFGRTEVTKWLTASASYGQGTGVNYLPAAGLDPFLGRRRLAQVGVTLSPFSRVRIDETLIYDDLYTRNAVGGRSSDSLVFKNPITRSKINLQFNRQMAVRLIVDTHSVTPDQQLVSLPHTRRVTGDVLFSYILNPGTVLYFGYSDNYENLALINGPPRDVVATRNDLNPTARQLFLKVSYLLRY